MYLLLMFSGPSHLTQLLTQHPVLIYTHLNIDFSIVFLPILPLEILP
jgi:hypothetical protein